MQAGVYIRVSDEDQVEGYSLDAQERLCRLHAQMHGWEVYDVYADEGVSAYKEEPRNRPQMRRLLDDIDAGIVQAVIVHKIDRLSRITRATLEVIDDWDKRGIVFVSVGEQIDFSTPQGRFALQIFASVAELYSRNLSTEVKKGLNQKALNGGWIGHIPYGYDRGNDGRLVPNASADVVRRIFELYATGVHSVSDIAQQLNAQGTYARGRSNEPTVWTETTLTKLLRKRAYLGSVIINETEYPNMHPALVEQDTWEAVQYTFRQRAQWHGLKLQPRRTDLLLAGRMRCDVCGSKVWVKESRVGETYYYCSGRKNRQCAQPGVALRDIEPAVLGIVNAIRVPNEHHRELVTMAQEIARQQNQAHVADGPTPDMIKRRAQRIAKLYADELMSDEDYEEARRELEQMKRRVRPAAQHYDEARVVDLLNDLPRVLEHLTRSEQKQVIHALFETLWLRDKRIVAITPRRDVWPIVQAAVQLCVLPIEVRPPTVSVAGAI